MKYKQHCDLLDLQGLKHYMNHRIESYQYLPGHRHLRQRYMPVRSLKAHRANQMDMMLE
jgi:hypothetical protein